MSATMPASATARRHGRLWGSRAEAWAEQEEMEARRFDEAIERLPIAPGRRVLEVGCGSGVFLRRAADRGARVSGIDASERLVEIARRRVPEADVRVGDLEALPWEDAAFDAVAGFNAFFFAADMTAALREAGRVAKPGAPVLIQVWGRPERCDLTPALQAIRALRPAPPGGAPPPRPLSEPGVLEGIASEAGLEPQERFAAQLPLEYPDEATLLRRLLSPGGAAEAIDAAGEEAVAEAIREALAPHRGRDGRYRLENEWHYLIARA